MNAITNRFVSAKDRQDYAMGQSIPCTKDSIILGLWKEDTNKRWPNRKERFNLTWIEVRGEFDPLGIKCEDACIIQSTLYKC